MTLNTYNLDIDVSEEEQKEMLLKNEEYVRVLRRQVLDCIKEFFINEDKYIIAKNEDIVNKIVDAIIDCTPDFSRYEKYGHKISFTSRGKISKMNNIGLFEFISSYYNYLYGKIDLYTCVRMKKICDLYEMICPKWAIDYINGILIKHKELENEISENPNYLNELYEKAKKSEYYKYYLNSIESLEREYNYIKTMIPNYEVEDSDDFKLYMRA